MNNNYFKKYKELQSLLPLMKVLGYDASQAERVLTPVEEPDFLFTHEDLNIGIEVTECHPENTKGKGAKNLLVARQRTYEICKFIEESQDALGEIVNYRLGFYLMLLFDLQKPKLKRPKKERIQNEVLAEMRKRIKNGDYIAIEDDYQKLQIEWRKNYHYIRDIVVDEPLEKSIVTYSYPARSASSIEHDILLDAIAQKETRLSSYRNNYPQTNEFWLCLTIPMGVDRTLDGLQELEVESLYDRVYITSTHECIRIK